MKYTLCLLFVLGTHAWADELPPPVQNVLKLRSVPQNTVSIQVTDVNAGNTVVSWLANEHRNPASTMKLLTTLVALDRLGPAYRWRTEVYARGDIKGGVLDGDLLLKGYGDPFLVTERVWQLARQIRHSGIQDISGDLLLDDSWFFVGEYDPAAFDRQPLRAYNVAPNALLMNFKVVRYWFQPEVDGSGVSVRVDPAIDNLRVVNRLKLRNSSCRGFQRGISVDMNDVLDEVTFSGSFPNRCKAYAMDRTALSHREFVHGLFGHIWRDSGGEFDGRWRAAVAAPDEEPLVVFESLPLADVIARVNKHSNNVMARHLLYTLSAELHGAPGTEAGGVEAIADWLGERGFESCCTAIQNGAGLSRDTRMSAGDLVRLLEYAWQQPYMPEYLSSLSVSGADGTLRRRFDDPALAGQAHLKSGSLDHVAALAGFLQSKSGRRFALAVIVNHENAHRGPGDEIQEALLRWLYEH